MNGQNYLLPVNTCRVNMLKHTDIYLRRAGYTIFFYLQVMRL